MNIKDDGTSFRIEVTEEILKFFDRFRIYDSDQKKPRTSRRWKTGDVLRIQKDASIEPYSTYKAGANIFQMGAFSYSMSALPVGIRVGRYCSIAQDVEAFGASHPMKAVTTSLMVYDHSQKSVRQAYKDMKLDSYVTVPNPQDDLPVIRNDVWIGAGVRIKRGVRIGHGSIVGAGSVVTKDVPAFSIVAGNPARFIRRRFPEAVYQPLLDMKWWRYDFRDLSQMDMGNPERFVAQLQERSPDLKEWKPRRVNLWDAFSKMASNPAPEPNNEATVLKPFADPSAEVAE